MRKRLKEKWKRWVASLLIVTMIGGSVSLEGLAAENQPSTQVDESGEAVGETMAETVNGETSYVIDKADVIEAKNTEDSTTYDAGNGVLVTEFYGQNVRFRDETGELVDYDASLTEIKNEKSTLGNPLELYAFENQAGDKKHYFPDKLTEETPILMENDEYQIRFVPIENPEIFTEPEVSEELQMLDAEADITTDEFIINVTETETAELQLETVENIYEEEKMQPIKASYAVANENKTYQYTSFESGVKEEIILEEQPESNQFSFLLELPGLSIRENNSDEGLSIYDGDTIVAGIMAPNMNDATGNAYSEALSYSLEMLDEEAGKYCITLTVSEEYLSHEDRQYPITIDPTFTWNDNSQISDVYVLSGYPSYNYYDAGASSFYVGYGNQGASIGYMSLASLSSISKKYIKSATLTLCECSNSLSGKTVYIYRVTGSWSHSSISWNNQPGYYGTAVASFTSKGAYQTSSINLTSLIQGYANGAYSNYGILIKNPNESSKNYFTKFFGARHTSTGYRPKLTVEYYDRPATATSVKLTPAYIKPGESTQIDWAGITSGELSYIQYRIAEYDESTSKEGTAVTAYSADTKIGTTANGSGTITTGSAVTSGSSKTYKVAVRGVGTSGAVGDENWALLKVDNAVPTGSIKVLASGTAEETTVLQDTVEIVGEVDGTGSPIKSSSMKLYDSQGNFVQDIYTNSTLSKIQTVFTPELANGTYTLKLTMEDSVGFTAEVTKEIQVVNRLAAPVVQTTISNQATVEIPWEFPYAASEVCGIAYKLPESTEWNTINDISGTKGTISVALPDAEGTYDVAICGIDSLGTRGAEATAKCIIDKTLPQVEITGTERGLIYGTVTDDNLSGWTVTLKETGSTEEEILFTGKRKLENGYIGFLDRSKLDIGVTYELWLKATDKAGNEYSVSVLQERLEGEILAERLTPDFAVKRPAYTAHTPNHIVFPANTTAIQLTEWPLAGAVPDGTTRWYSDGALVSSEKTWSNNLPTDEESHHILVVIEKDGQYYYSQSRTQNMNVSGVEAGATINLPENCVSFRLNTGEETVNAQLVLDGGTTINITSGTTYHVAQLTNGAKATASSVQITPVDSETDISDWTLEMDVVDVETFHFTASENYHPYEVAVKDKLNYKTYLKWDGVDGEWPENISYEIYRGQEEGFTPSAENLIASDVKANYWAEMNVNYSRTFYYRIRAVEKDADGAVVRASSYSSEIASTVVDADEYVKRMGIKEYWEYAEFATPSGNGYIEKSQGNLVYTQVDAEIPNEQLPVVLERTYNSQSSAKTAFGVGWTHSFDMELLNICKNDSLDFKNIVLKDGNGTLFFYNQSDDGSYVSSMGKYTTLKKEDKTEEVELPDKEVGVKDKTKKVEIKSSFTLTTKDNVEYRFNSSGQLIYMSEANGNFLLFEYDSNKGLLSKVTTSKNLTMEFVYYTEADYVEGESYPDVLTVKEVILPDGSKMTYDYENARLTKAAKVGTDGTSTLNWSMDYNEGRQLATLSDACGNLYQMEYSDEKAERVTYPNGEAISLTYDDSENKTTTYKEVTENGETVKILLETNTFEAASGNSIQMVDCNGNSVTYEYTDNLRSKAIYSMTYQELENQQVVEKTTEKTETTKYSTRENVTEQVDEDGIKTTYTYNENAPENLRDYPVGIKEVNAEGYLITDITYTYDSYGNVIRSYDSVDGLVVETTYYEEDDPETGKLKGEIKSEREYYLNDSDNQSSTETTYSYDATGKKTVVTTEKSGQYEVTTTTVYDVMGRQISSTDTWGLTTTTEYDPFGRVSKITAKQGDITDIVTRQYDANGTLIKEVKEDGTIYTYSYDNMNRLVAESIVSGDLEKTWSTDYSYGSVEINTGKGKETIQHVLITTEKNPDGDILAVTYKDTLGKTVRQKQNGLYVDYAYNDEGQIVASCQLGTNPDNANPVVTAYLYDKSGNASGQILNPGYDSSTGNFTVTSDSLTQSMTYDSVGNVISTTDGIGNTTSYTYDAYGRVTSVTLPTTSEETANVTTYKYDQFDATTKNGTTQTITTDALGRTSVTTYNMTLQPVSISDKGDGTVTAINQNYTYDSKGRTSEVKGSLGTSTIYEYDGKDRVTTVHYKNASGVEELRTCYTYDKSDNVTTMLDYTVSNGTATLYRYTGFTYDRLKRLTELVELNTNKAASDITAEEKAANTTKYTYDIDGNLLSVTYPESDWNVASLKYSYDQNKWLQNVTAVLKDGTEVLIRSYTYDNYGSVAEIKDYRALSNTGEKVNDPAYTVCTYTYDAYRRPASMSYADSTDLNTEKEAYTYTYDKNSRLVRETIQNLYPEEVSDRQNEVRSYTYDVRGNLVQTEVEDLLNMEESYVTAYTYDAVGNRLTQTKTTSGQTETTQYTYNSLNQLLTSTTTKADGTVTETKTYQYDANGNQIKEADSVSNTETLNAYDPAGRLASCIKKENSEVTLEQTNKYNGSGARIQKKESVTEEGVSTETVNNYFYSQGGVLYTEDGSGNGTSLNLQGISGNVIATAREEAGVESYYYYHKDPTGSTTNLRSADGTTVVSYQYTDFGETSIYGDTDFYNEICYNGAIYDESTGLYYLSARYYDPEDGRFLTRDSYRGTATNAMTWHLYAYCANNPINYDDPSGHLAVRTVVGGIVGGLVGFAAGVKLAKSTNKTWKKVAIIAGCTLAGGAVGAVVGTVATPKNIASAVKRVASYTKNKLPSIRTTLKKMKTTVQKVSTGARKTVSQSRQVISNGARNSKYSGANNAADGARLKEYYRQAEKYGKDFIKELENGRFRFYEKIKAARNQGEMMGARHVREWDPFTGKIRDWYETLDYMGNIRQVRPDPKITGGKKVHYMFDKLGNYIGKWSP